MSVIDDPTVHELVDAVFSTTLGMPAQPAAPGSTEETLAASVSIVGEWEGDIILLLPRAVAEAAARRMFMLSEGDALSVDDTRDAVGELTNQVAGSLKAVLPGPSDLDVPTLHAHDEGIPGHAEARWFEVPHGSFCVAVCPVEDDQAGAA